MSSYHVDTLQSTVSKNHPVQFDKNGVPQAKIPYTQSYDYHVTDIASYAIMNENNKNIFQSQIKWLVENIEENGAYTHHFRFPFYKKFPSEWIGGLAQGLAISALCIAHRKSNDDIYLDTAQKAFKCLQKNCVIIENGFTWIEEYPLTLHILNGFIYAIFGVYDLSQLTKQNNEKNLFNQCIKTLEYHLTQYDIGYWSRYSLHDTMPSTIFYHNVHVKQLNAIYKITKKDLFLTYSEKWKSYSEKKMNYNKVKISRTMKHLGKHGIYGSYKQYQKRRRWLQSTSQ